MPGGDRTGPGGLGPLSGRGMGNCAGSRNAGYGAGMGRGYGRGMGGGRGFGRGMGRGAGAGFRGGWGARQGYQQAQSLSPADEAGTLKEEEMALKNELKAVQDRLSTLESDKNAGK